MGDNLTKFKSPKILVWYGNTIIILGVLIISTGVFGVLVGIIQGNGLFSGLYTIYDLVGTGLAICAFGAAISLGKRWHIFALMNIIFFGSVILGFFSMAGRETNIGYYIWTIGGVISLSLAIILYIYWEDFIDS